MSESPVRSRQAPDAAVKRRVGPQPARSPGAPLSRPPRRIVQRKSPVVDAQVDGQEDYRTEQSGRVIHKPR
jgi:hypothetical protein